MAFPWLIAVSIAQAAYAAYTAHLSAEAEEDTAAAIQKIKLSIDQMNVALNDAKNQLITEMLVLRIAELKGQIEGYVYTYDAYNPQYNTDAEEIRLINLIDNAAVTLGELGQLIDLPPTAGQENLAVETLPIYVDLLYMRAQAMAERERAFRNPEVEDILSSFVMAKSRLANTLKILRSRSDSRFGPPKFRQVTTEGYTESFWSCRFDSGEVTFLWCFSGRPCTEAVAKAKWNALRDETYHDVAGVNELIAMKARIDAAIDDLKQRQVILKLSMRLHRSDKPLARALRSGVRFRNGEIYYRNPLPG